MKIWSKQTLPRTKHDPEYELLDTGVFADNRYFDVDGRVRESIA